MRKINDCKSDLNIEENIPPGTGINAVGRTPLETPRPVISVYSTSFTWLLLSGGDQKGTRASSKSHSHASGVFSTITLPQASTAAKMTLNLQTLTFALTIRKSDTVVAAIPLTSLK